MEIWILLEKINDYKKLCERRFDIQVYLYDTDVLSDPTNESTTSSNISDEKEKKKKRKGFV